MSHASPALSILSEPLAAGLYVVATPIGHLRDISLRALDILANASLVLCEDTRHSRKLLTAYGLRPKLLAYHDHNGAQLRPKILAQLAQGASIALISDAGTPLISDPGYDLVVQAQAKGHKVFAVPGASSVLAALMVAGLPSDKFHFWGFLPPKSRARRTQLHQLADLPHTVVCFETARRLSASLSDIASIAPDRMLVVARELTKKFETLTRGTAAQLCDHFTTPPKGEVVLLFAPQAVQAPSEQDLSRALADAMRRYSAKQAVRLVADKFHIPRQHVYAAALAQKKLTQKKSSP